MLLSSECFCHEHFSQIPNSNPKQSLKTKKEGLFRKLKHSAVCLKTEIFIFMVVGIPIVNVTFYNIALNKQIYVTTNEKQIPIITIIRWPCFSKIWYLPFIMQEIILYRKSNKNNGSIDFKTCQSCGIRQYDTPLRYFHCFWMIFIASWLLCKTKGHLTSGTFQ